MRERFSCVLKSRGVLKVTGPDARTFLQGIVSNDLARLSPEQALWAAFLTAQGRFLHDFFILDGGEALLLDCEAARRQDLLRRLSLYKLRSKVALSDATEELLVVALWGEGALAALGLPERPGAARAWQGGLVFADPRLAAAGARALLPQDRLSVLEEAGFATAGPEGYDRLRIALGLPDGSRDMEVEKALLLENGFDELGGVDWQKGCFLGQELTARTKYRGLVKRRLLPVRLAGEAPESGTPVLAAGKEVGTLRSSADGWGLALLRLEALEGPGPLTAGGVEIRPEKPAWFRS